MEGWEWDTRTCTHIVIIILSAQHTTALNTMQKQTVPTASSPTKTASKKAGQKARKRKRFQGGHKSGTIPSWECKEV